MNVDYWFDPICPFCWATSRWINRVGQHRDLNVNWRSISLLFKNEMTDPAHPFFEGASRSRDLLRVAEAVRAAGHEDQIGDLYTEYGRHIHHRGEIDFDVAAVLERVGLAASLASALTDPSWDEAIRAAMADGLALTGPDVGTPLIAIDTKNGTVGLFGPVITEVPDDDAAIELWDGFLKMANTSGFFELKRTRTSAPTLLPESVLDAQLAR
jgi:2-hydroxychromene-2-carboxylate isomerase